MRTIRLEERDSGHTWAWLAAGAVVGLGVGVLVAERTRGRRVSLRKLVARGRELASGLAENVGPLLETARELKDAWAGAAEDGDEADVEDDDLNAMKEDDAEEFDDDLDDDLDDDDSGDDDDDDDDDAGDDDDDDHHDGDDDDSRDHDDLDARVLEAFSHDPILAERAVEIEDVGDGDILLHGRVRSPREVKHAITLARGVPGVTRVREKLAVVRRR